MNTKKYKIYFGILMMLVVTTFTSCDKVEEPNIGGTSVESMSGDWWVVALEPDGVTPAYGGDYVQFSTYNTASDDGGMWLDDHDNFMQIKSKVTAKTADMTFAGEVDATELYADATVTVTNGKITSGTYVTASKTAVDEIVFEAEFSWEVGVVYIFKGHKRTGFAEDEDPTYSN